MYLLMWKPSERHVSFFYVSKYLIIVICASQSYLYHIVSSGSSLVIHILVVMFNYLVSRVLSSKLYVHFLASQIIALEVVDHLLYVWLVKFYNFL